MWRSFRAVVLKLRSAVLLRSTRQSSWIAKHHRNHEVKTDCGNMNVQATYFRNYTLTLETEYSYLLKGLAVTLGLNWHEPTLTFRRRP